MPPTCRRDEGGLTVLEVVVALAVVSVVFGSLTVLVGRTVDALSTATDRDGAQQVATATLEEAKAFGCGLARGDESPAQLTSVQQHCWGGLGDATFSTVVGSTTYAGSLRTSWEQLGGGCGDPQRPKAILAEADGLARIVTIRWTAGGQTHQLTSRDYEAVPPDAVAYRDTSRGALLLKAAPGTTASIARGASPPVTREVDASGCALFPFLPAGAVSWTVGSARGIAAIAAESITVEPGGSVVA